MKTLRPSPFLAPLCLALSLLLASPSGYCADAKRPIKEDAILWVKNNGGNPVDMKPFAEKIEHLPKEEKVQLVQVIQPFLKSKKWEEQANAIYLLGFLGEAAVPTVPGIIKAMDAEMSNVAWEAPPALARIGTASVPPLILAIKAESPGVSKRIYNLTKCVEALGPKATAAAPALVPFLDNGHNTGAIAAMEAIGPSCLPAICKGFDNDPKGGITVHADYVFQKLGLAPSTKAIVDFLKGKPSTLGKKLAVFALARMKPAPDKIAIPSLCKVLAEGKPETMENAADALEAIGPSAAPDILELASHNNPSVKALVQKILRTYGTDKTAAALSVKVLVNKLNNPSAQEAAEAAATILKLSPDNTQALAKMKQLLTSKKPGEITAALRALPRAEAGGRGLTEALIKILKDGETGDRILAVGALGSIGPSAKAAVQPLIEAATREHPIVVSGREGFNMTGEVQQASLVALGKIGKDAAPAIPLFSRLLKDPSQSLAHKEIYIALARMKGAALPAIPTVLECLKTNGNEREDIITMLTQLGPTARAAEPELRKLVLSTANGDHHLKLKAYQALLAVQPDSNKTLGDTRSMLKESDSDFQEAALKQIIKHPSLASNPEIAVLLTKGLSSSYYNVKQLSLEAIARGGSPDDSLLPKLIKENIGCSYSQPQKDNAFAAIKKMDPTGAKTIPLLQKPLQDSLSVRGSVELLEFIGSPQCLSIAKETRKKWKL
ncbi:MAG: hypothetical protein SFV17_19270 [Candidatus Obscuribacter sp.]|nr:hypothetical protein [Candidatus Obscuribacter sp.]